MNANKPTIEDFYNLIDEHKDLTTEGYGIFSHACTFEPQRNDLYEQFEAFQAAVQFLTNDRTFTDLDDEHRTLFRLRQHIANYCFDMTGMNYFISAGAVVAAALYLGLPYERIETYPGVMFETQNQEKEQLTNDNSN
jgi:hypothetical protein